MSSLDETMYKLKEFGVWSDGNAEARYDADPAGVQQLIKDFKMKVIHLDEEEMEMEFDVIGVGAPIVNAIRRILIAEIPTMAIDKVHLYNNITVIPDEVLGHRLGMVPINVDPRLFSYKVADGEHSEEDTLKFELKVSCTRKPNAPKDGPVPAELAYSNDKVLSGHLKNVPIGKRRLYEDVRPVKEDILLAVLRPGHEIDLEAFCVKNIGRAHAKFSPVSLASYRLMPQMKLLEEITGDRAHLLAKLYPGVVKVSKKKDKEVAKVVNERKIMCNRNLFFHDELKNAVEISKLKDHYIFTVESTGALMPEVLVSEAIDVLKDKCTKFMNELKSLKI